MEMMSNKELRMIINYMMREFRCNSYVYDFITYHNCDESIEENVVMQVNCFVRDINDEEECEKVSSEIYNNLFEAKKIILLKYIATNYNEVPSTLIDRICNDWDFTEGDSMLDFFEFFDNEMENNIEDYE